MSSEVCKGRNDSLALVHLSCPRDLPLLLHVADALGLGCDGNDRGEAVVVIAGVRWGR